MGYKMIAMDMDGTLLTTEKEVTEYSKNVLKKAADAGVKLVVCTGRIYTSALVYAKLIGTVAPVIASNGAYIREKDKNEIIYSKTLKKDEAYYLVKTAKSFGFYPHLFTSDTIYSEKMIYSSKNYSIWNENLPEEERIKVEIVEDLYKVIDENDGLILKVVVMSEELDKIAEFKKQVGKEQDVSMVASWYNNVEVMSKGISKGNAVKVLSEYYGIPSEEIICIGDNENDLSMIEFAGMGIAMGNAEDVVKKAANYITDTNENNGVAKAIEKFILNA
jgi:Cof subfamily protein (haloacid dehalogenase superfamily)